MKIQLFKSIGLFLLCSLLIYGCAPTPVKKAPIKEPIQKPTHEPIAETPPRAPLASLVKLENQEIPDFFDDLDMESLETAIGRSVHYLSKLPMDRLMAYGNDTKRVGEILDSMQTFLNIINSTKKPGEINRLVRKYFDVYQPPPVGKEKEPVLFTGYYEPILEASRVRTKTHKYPIYKKPKDLITVDLTPFHPRFKGQKVVGRIARGTFLPYYERMDIDTRGVLGRSGLEMAWFSDPLDPFFLQIQGSGKLKFPDGETINVNYAAANGREYRSIGKFLISEGKVPREKASLDSIKKFLRENPKERQRILNHNKSYIFFREVPIGPQGSIAEPVTAGRSIATDSSLFPKGSLAFIQTRVPEIDGGGMLKGWKDISRFVLNQDTGGAIKGVGRVDLFFGSGDLAGREAGYMNRQGRLYFLVKKNRGKAKN